MQRKYRAIIATMWILTGLTAVGLGGTIWMMRSSAGPATALPRVVVEDNADGKLPVLFDAATFSLTDQNAKPFSSEELRGKVWVADFIFTSCSSMCPLMTQHFVEFQNLTIGSPVQMVSFSVDPETDTPAVLKGYARTNQADESRWHFLTGTKDQTWDVSKGMKLAVGPDRGSQVMHSSHFLLVDGQGKVRGVYDSNQAGFLNKLVADAKRLAANRD